MTLIMNEAHEKKCNHIFISLRMCIRHVIFLHLFFTLTSHSRTRQGSIHVYIFPLVLRTCTTYKRIDTHRTPDENDDVSLVYIYTRYLFYTILNNHIHVHTTRRICGRIKIDKIFYRTLIIGWVLYIFSVLNIIQNCLGRFSCILMIG